VARSLGGLRLRLALAISAVSLAVVAGSFVALRESTGADLRDRIDQELEDQWAEFQAAVLDGEALDRSSLARRSERFVRSQRYHPSSRIFLVQIEGRPVVTNQRAVVEREEENELEELEGDEEGSELREERAEAREERREERANALEETGEALGERGLLDAPSGLATVSGAETGNLRVLSEPIRVGGRRIGAFRVADPLTPVEDAQSGLSRAFVLVGLAALLVSVVVAAAVAALMARPLRRMATVASAVDAGELRHRIGRLGRRDEVGVLADAFDRMLDRLELAFRRQREFVSDASHELRTPLTVLRGQLELLDKERDPERRRRTVATATREIDRMNRLVDDMLTLASAESAELVSPGPIELAGFVEDLRRDLPLLGERDYQVTAARVGVLEADPERLHQVLRNLVRNAVSVTRPGDRITVTAIPRDGRLEFAISDQGPGIPEGELERVFDRFHRTDHARDREGGGTGLGLAIAKAIVEAHGGWIRAESPPGGGTTVRFELPGYRPAT
jgi:signal transduction histidine kinase